MHIHVWIDDLFTTVNFSCDVHQIHMLLIYLFFLSYYCFRDGRSMMSINLVLWNDTALLSLKGKNVRCLHQSITGHQSDGRRAEMNVGTGDVNIFLATVKILV